MNQYSLAQYYDNIADALAGPGFIVLNNALPADLTCGLVDFAIDQGGEFKRAGVGRDGDYQVNDSIRSDLIQWLEPNHVNITKFLSVMDQLRSALNERLFLGLSDYEAHFAHYNPGSFYKKHRDAFRGKPGRKISTVFYLNPDWDLSAGGELALYDETDENELARIAPECGKLVLFLSEEFPHEVLPATRPRISIAGWFRTKT